MTVLPVTKILPIVLLTILPAWAGPPMTSRFSSDFNKPFDASVLIVFLFSDVDSIKHGIVKTSSNKANRPYTILLVGETGVGKSLVFEFIANVLSGKDVDHYNFRTLDYTNERSNFGDQSRTKSSRLYEITSNNDILVNICIFRRYGHL